MNSFHGKDLIYFFPPKLCHYDVCVQNIQLFLQVYYCLVATTVYKVQQYC